MAETPETPTPSLAARLEADADRLTPHVCRSCDGTGWHDDANWSPEDWQLRSGKWERSEGEGLIPCGACSLGDWSTHRDERTEPTTVIDGLDYDEQPELSARLRAAAAQLRQLDRIKAAAGDARAVADALIESGDIVVPTSAPAAVDLLLRLADAWRPTMAPDAPTPDPSPAEVVAIPDDQPDRGASDGDEHPECSWCGGDGWGECDDPIQCLDPRCNGELCPCSACYGRGYDQEVW